MGGGIGKSAEGFNQLLSFQLGGFLWRPALYHLGEAGSGGNGGYAPLGSEADLSDAPVEQLHSQLHNVATDRMLQTNLRIRIRQITHVAGVLKVVEDGFRVAHAPYNLGHFPSTHAAVLRFFPIELFRF